MLTSEPYGQGPVPQGSVALVVEVSDASLDFDMRRKARLYAAGKVPEYWIVDIGARVIHQFWMARDDAYSEYRPIAFGQELEAATIKGLAVRTDTL